MPHPILSQLLRALGATPPSIDASATLSVLELTDRPRLSRRVRLRFDHRSSTHLLCAPERVLLLNESAADIVLACSGLRTVEQIARYVACGAAVGLVTPDVHEFLNELWYRHFIDLMRPAWGRPS